MGTPSHMCNAPVDPYVLEYAVNMRWLLHYASHQLDPTVEQLYPSVVNDATKMNRVLGRMQFACGCNWGDLPFGVLRLARDAALYLLVSDHLLGGCPPTMHPFLQHAAATAVVDTTSRHASHSATPRSNQQSQQNVQPKPSVDLNVSFPSDADEIEEGLSRGGASELDVQRLAEVSPSSSTGTLLCPVEAHGSETQGMLLLLRWLFSEGVLAEDELASTLEMGNDCKNGSQNGSVSPQDSKDDSGLCRHRALAQRMAQIMPFYLGAHLLLSRSLLLQYSATALTVDSVMQHVAHLQAAFTAPRRQHLGVRPPPTSVEGALLEWLQIIADSFQKDGNQPVAVVRVHACAPLNAFLRYGPFCEDVVHPSDRNFFRIVQSGECLCIAMLFYYPNWFPLSDLDTALHRAESAAAACADEVDQSEILHHYQTLCYWGAIIAACEPLGVWPLMTSEEIASFGGNALPLHLFRFVQELFACLATNAEEDVRVSADEAWWEHMRLQEGLTDVLSETSADFVMHKPRELHQGTETVMKSAASANISDALLLLRRSMHDTFPPDAFQFQKREPSESATERVLVRSKDTSLAVGEATVKAPSPATGKGSLENDGGHSIQTVADEQTAAKAHNTTMGSAHSESSTRFSIEWVHTQADQRGSSRRTHDGSIETATSVLRPMIHQSRHNPQLTSTKNETSATTSGYTHRPSSLQLPSERTERAVAREAFLGSHLVDTYAHAQDAGEGDIIDGANVNKQSQGRAEQPLGAAPPTVSELLLRMRAVEALLEENAEKHRTSPRKCGKSADPTGKALPLHMASTFAPDESTSKSSRIDGALDTCSRITTRHSPFTGSPLRDQHLAAGISVTSGNSSLTQSTKYVVRNRASQHLGVRKEGKEVAVAAVRNELESPFPSGLNSNMTAAAGGSERWPPLEAMKENATLRNLHRGNFRPSDEVKDCFGALKTPTGQVRLQEGDDKALVSTPLPMSSVTAVEDPLPSLRTSASASLPPVGLSLDPMLGEIALNVNAEMLLRSSSFASTAPVQVGHHRRLMTPHASSMSPSETEFAVQDVSSSFLPTVDVCVIEEENSDVSSPIRSYEKVKLPRSTMRMDSSGLHPKRSDEAKDIFRAEDTAQIPDATLNANDDENSHLQQLVASAGGAQAPPPSIVPVLSSACKEDSIGSSRQHKNTSNPIASSSCEPCRTLLVTPSVSSCATDDFGTLLTAPANDKGVVNGTLRQQISAEHQAEGQLRDLSSSSPSRQILRNPAPADGASSSTVRESERLQELLQQLSGINLSALATKDREELYRVLEQQQRVVEQLKATLNLPLVPRSGSSPSNSPYRALSRRQQGSGPNPSPALVHQRGKRTNRLAQVTVRSASWNDAVEEEAALRRTATSIVTLESGASVPFTTQSDFAGQLAEAELTSMVSTTQSLGFAIGQTRDSPHP